MVIEVVRKLSYFIDKVVLSGFGRGKLALFFLFFYDYFVFPPTCFVIN